MAQQGSPPRGSSRPPGHRSHRDKGARREGRGEPRERAPWQQPDAFGPADEADMPPWAGLSLYQARADGPEPRSAEADLDGDAGPGSHGHSRPGRFGLAPARRPGRAARARLRRSRRRVYRWSATAIVACIVAAVAAVLATQHGAAPQLYVTTLQRGEFKSVPNSCTAVSAQTLSSYVPGPDRKKTQTISGSGQSECSFTVDRKPVFLVLDVTAQAFQPFAAASGDGSASQNALDNFNAARQALAAPPKRSPLPAAVITTLPGLGQKAFSAFQPEHVSGIVTDVVTVNVLERNVLITVSLAGQESGHGFGPVSQAVLQAGARAAARDVLAKVRTQPTA